MTTHPSPQSTSRLTRIALFAALMAVSAYIRIPLGPVPLTMQTFTALTAGYTLGARRGMAAMTLYMGAGLLGVPVFTGGGGPGYVLSPTFGYIAGFVCAAGVTGMLAPLNHRQSPFAAYGIMLAGMAALYVPGVIWLGFILSLAADAPPTAGAVIKIGFMLPVIGDLITAVPAAYLSVRLRKKLR